jgi:hypothetical protein
MLAMMLRFRDLRRGATVIRIYLMTHLRQSPRDCTIRQIRACHRNTLMDFIYAPPARFGAPARCV